MWLQHKGNSHIRSNSWKGTGQNGTGKEKSSKRVKDTDKDQRYKKLPWVCKLLLTFYSKLQSYSKTTKWAERQKGLEMGRRTPECIQWTQGEDYKSTSPFFTQKRRKIQSGNRHIRTCNRRSTISRIRWEMETHSIFIKNNVTSRMKLQDLRQGTTSNSRSSHKIETILIGCSRTFQSLDGS